MPQWAQREGNARLSCREGNQGRTRLASVGRRDRRFGSTGRRTSEVMPCEPFVPSARPWMCAPLLQPAGALRTS